MSRHLTSDGSGDDLLHIGHVYAEAGDLLPVNVDDEIGLAGDLFDLNILDAIDLLASTRRSPVPCREAHQGRLRTA